MFYLLSDSTFISIMHNLHEVTNVKEARKRFMKPDRNKDVPLDDLFKPFLVKSCYGFPYTVERSKAKMFSNDKNLWIIGTEEQLEDFIYKAIGKSQSHVYDNNNKHKKYFGQPFIVTRLYDKRKVHDKIYELRELGDWFPSWRAHVNFDKTVHPDLFHSIVLSTYTMDEYCKDYPREIDGLKWRYDVLNLN